MNHPRQLDLSGSPVELMRRWPGDAPMVALCSGHALPRHSGSPWARWSLLASPDRIEIIPVDHPAPLTWLAEIVGSTQLGPCPTSDGPPFQGGWVVALSYDLVAAIEPRSRLRARRVDPRWPFGIVMWRCPWAMLWDHEEARWFGAGEQPGAAAMAARLRHAPMRPESAFRLHGLGGDRDSSAYRRSVARAVEYIRAGDCFQVNLAHQLRARFDGSARGLASAMIGGADPWYGAYLEIDHASERRAVACASPELLLNFDARTRRVVTRPIKGTRPGASDPRGLEHSLKDQAELNMIVDLMRNDLGRVAEFGSVRVDEARAIERHASGGGSGGVLHGVATVSARVRPDRSLGDVLGACFPGGSVTGAPKVRAVQIIDELEPEPRGLYTGAIGMVSDTGDAQFNIAIRTAVLRGATPGGPGLDRLDDAELRFGVGAGIVADSDPEAEWRETLDKAGVLLDRFPVIAPARARAAPTTPEHS